MWPYKAHTRPCRKDSKTGIEKHEFQIAQMFPPLIKHDTMASMNTKYGIATYMTCPHS